MLIVESPLSNAAVICSFKYAIAIAVEHLCLNPKLLSVKMLFFYEIYFFKSSQRFF